MKRLRFRRTTLLAVGFGVVLAGLGFARIYAGMTVPVVMLSVLSVCFLTRKKTLSTLIMIALCGFVVGWWRGGQVFRQLEPYHDIALQKVTLRVVAEQDATYSDKGQLGFDASQAELLQPFRSDLPGKIKVEGFGQPAVFRGDVVEVTGKFYPTRGSRQGSVSFASLEVVGKQPALFDGVRRNFVAGITTALPEPHASFALGLLIGQRTTLPDTVGKQLASVGLTHIIAVSGYNLTIIIRAMRRAGSGRSKYQTTLASVVLVLGFLLITGFSASIVRAAIVSMLSLAAWYYGRTIRPVLLLVFTAAVTALWNPLYIWSDIGWYLSFLAFYGVLVLAPLIARRLYGKEQPKLVAALLLETCAAQLMTLPLILYIFNETSLVALFANVLVVPIVPVAMLLAFVAGLAGVVMPAVSGWVAWPAQAVLTYMLDISALLARTPHAVIKQAINLPAMLYLYGSLLLVSLVLVRKTGVKRDIIEVNEEILQKES